MCKKSPIKSTTLAKKTCVGCFGTEEDMKNTI